MKELTERHRLLGSTIRQLRVEKGLTQREFAPMAGTNQSYLWEIETGRVSVGIDVLCRIADALDVKVSDLIAF